MTKDELVNLVYDDVYEAMKHGQPLNDILLQLAAGSILYNVAVLTATLPWKHKLPNRSIFFERVRERIRTVCPEREHELLDGLA